MLRQQLTKRELAAARRWFWRVNNELVSQPECKDVSKQAEQRAGLLQSQLRWIPFSCDIDLSCTDEISLGSKQIATFHLQLPFRPSSVTFELNFYLNLYPCPTFPLQFHVDKSLHCASLISIYVVFSPKIIPLDLKYYKFNTNELLHMNNLTQNDHKGRSIFLKTFTCHKMSDWYTTMHMKIYIFLYLQIR